MKRGNYRKRSRKKR